MTRLLELSARPAAVALLGALGGGFGTAPRPRARAPAAPTAKDGTPAVAGKEAGKEETSSDLLHDDEQQWAERWLALTAAQLAPAPPARRRFPRVPLLPRRPPPAERALLAHLKGLAAISPAAGMVSAQALATSPPTRLASGAALLENAASSFHSCARCPFGTRAPHVARGHIAASFRSGSAPACRSGAPSRALSHSPAPVPTPIPHCQLRRRAARACRVAERPALLRGRFCRDRRARHHALLHLIAPEPPVERRLNMCTC